MGKFGGSKMYPRDSAIAYSASNRVGNFALGIDNDFFRSLSRMAVPTATVRERTGEETHASECV